MSQISYNITNHFIPKYGHLIAHIQHYQFHDQRPVNLHPTGAIELIVQNGRFSQANQKTDGWQERPTSFIGGLHQHSFSILPMGAESSLISISFNASAAKRFIPDDLSLFKNQIVPLNAVYGARKISQLDGLGAGNVDLEINRIEKFLDEVFMSKPETAIDKALRLLKKAKGCIAISTLAQQVGLGDSQFRRRFLIEVGIAPKVYARIIRIAAIERLFQKGVPQKLTDLAYQFDYFDQAHFTNDFKSVVGMSPKKYVRSIAK